MAVAFADLADRCGALAWYATRLFEVEGAWSVVVDDPRLAAHLATHSRYHGWHAELWIDVLPDAPALDGLGRVVPPPDGAAAMAGLDGATTDGERLAALYGDVLPRVLAEVAALLVPGVASAEVVRVAELVRNDLRTDLEGGLVIRFGC